jgi:hypothetical protein
VRWTALTRDVNTALAHPEVAGVIISHGTDTAYWLDLTVDSDKPVVLIGAQLSFDTGCQYAVLEVSFGFRGKKLPGDGVVFERAWQIVARPVPRILRHAINQLLKKQAFPAVRRWLFERSNLSSSSSLGDSGPRVYPVASAECESVGDWIH